MCQSVFLNKVSGFSLYNFIEKDILAQVFSCEFCEISKNFFFTEHRQATAFVLQNCFKRANVACFTSCLPQIFSVKSQWTFYLFCTEKLAE